MLRVVAIAIGLLKMLLELQQTRKTGALDAVGPNARVRLFVEDGSVVFADEGTVGETLGRILVRERVLTPEQYASAIERMSDLRTAGKHAKLGEVFVELGLLTKDQVFAALAAQVQQKVMRALAWSSATFRFVESLGPLDIADRFTTAVEPLVIAALRLADRERIDALLSQARPRYASLRGDVGAGGGSTKLESIARVNAFRLPAAEDAFARSLDGSRSVTELLAEVDEPKAPHVDRGVVLAALLLTDALDLHRGPTAVRPMGLPRALARTAAVKAKASAMIAEVGAAQAQLRAPVAVAPVAVAPVAVAPVVAAPVVAAPVAVAPVAEAPPESSPRMPDGAKMAPLLAEKAYQSGKKLVRAHRLAEAVVDLRRAASLYKAVEYDLWAAWAEARADARGEDAHADALRAAAELAIAQDTERGFATFVLGHLAKRRGDDARAAELFARARAIDPDVATIDAWEVRLRMGERSPASTRGEVTALAPLLTGEKESASANASASASADADADANASESESESESESGSESESESENAGGARQAEADAQLGAELEARAARAVSERARDNGRRANEGPDASARAKTSRGWLGPAALAVVVIGGIWLATRSAPHDTAPIVTAATTTTTTTAPTTEPAVPMASTSAVVPTAPSAAPSATTSAAPSVSTASSGASYAEVDAGLPSIDGTKGVLILPSAADSHRVYVDGRLAGVPPPPIVVGCGRHTIKIGSQGREQVVLVPCGGSLPLAYP